jgi:hypothetical protein
MWTFRKNALSRALTLFFSSIALGLLVSTRLSSDAAINIGLVLLALSFACQLYEMWQDRKARLSEPQ